MHPAAEAKIQYRACAPVSSCAGEPSTHGLRSHLQVFRHCPIRLHRSARRQRLVSEEVLLHFFIAGPHASRCLLQSRTHLLSPAAQVAVVKAAHLVSAPSQHVSVTHCSFGPANQVEGQGREPERTGLSIAGASKAHAGRRYPASHGVIWSAARMRSAHARCAYKTRTWMHSRGTVSRQQ